MSETAHSQGTIHLKLFVSEADSPRWAEAIEKLRENLEEREVAYELEIVDLHGEPALAEKYGILATPTLVQEEPHKNRVIGDLSDPDQTLDLLLGPYSP